MSVITRIAPSPTGEFHMGTARTALFSWLLARHYKGQFILRIEDTDQQRSTQDATKSILEAMDWLNLEYDQGPFYQSQRMDRYRAVIEKLLAENKAYRCYCSKARLDKLRQTQMAHRQKPRYDGHCRPDAEKAQTASVHLPNHAPHVIRFANPTEGSVSFIDQIHGEITTQNSELDDFIIARTDGMPTYNFTVVVDDSDMHISHVIRGDDHINNTPRQINLLNALNIKPPIYAHVPMILGPDKKKLSKRSGANSVMNYRAEGFLKEAVLNFLVRLGWAFGDQEIFSLEEMIQHFDLGNISKSPAVLDQNKLLWLNQHYLKHSPIDSRKAQLDWHLKGLTVPTTQIENKLQRLIEVQCGRVKTLKELAASSRYFFYGSTLPKKAYDKKSVQTYLTSEQHEILVYLHKQLSVLELWQAEAIHDILTQAKEQFNYNFKQVAQPLRVAVTGSTTSPSMPVTLELIGKINTQKRLKQAISICQNGFEEDKNTGSSTREMGA